MAKKASLGAAAYVGGYDLSGAVTALTRIGGGPSATLDMTTINQSGYERQGNMRTGEMAFTTIFQPDALNEHVALSPLPTADVIMTYFDGPAGPGNGAMSMVAKQVNYDPARGTDGSLIFSVDALSNGFGIEMNGIQHTTGIQVDTTATNSAGFDGAAQTAFGAQLYVQFFAVVGTSVTVKIQDFTSDTPASYADVAGLATTAVTPGQAPSAQRVAIANNATLRRWTRVVTVGTFTSASFAVMLVRNQQAGLVF